jgi:hypothetical protein
VAGVLDPGDGLLPRRLDARPLADLLLEQVKELGRAARGRLWQQDAAD